MVRLVAIKVGNIIRIFVKRNMIYSLESRMALLCVIICIGVFLFGYKRKKRLHGSGSAAETKTDFSTLITYLKISKACNTSNVLIESLNYF